LGDAPHSGGEPDPQPSSGTWTHAAKGRSHVNALLPRILEDAELRLSGCFRVLLAQLQMELEQSTARIEQMDRVIHKTAKENEGFPESAR
jgi:hypothetical protein